MDTALFLCRGNSGISDSSASQTVGLTGPGAAAGFNIDAGPAVIDLQLEHLVEASYKGRIRNCGMVYNPICSKSYDYDVRVGVGGATIGDPRVPGWFHGPESASGVHYYENA